LVVPALGLVSRIRFVDSEKLPKEGAYILAPNHFSEIDPLVIGAAVWKLGRLPRFLAKRSLFAIPVIGWLFAKTGQIPVDRSSRSLVPIESAERVIANGQLVIIYPEGTLTREPNLWPMRGRPGAARIALEHGIPVIPVAHWGTQQVLDRYGKRVHFFPRKTITVKFGDPVDLSEFEGKPFDTAMLNEATEVIMQAVTRQLEDLRGETAPAELWNPAQHDQTETGRFES
jgi:1-acyl-sn-glycerol-3-phosphate acyltransferase